MILAQNLYQNGTSSEQSSQQSSVQVESTSSTFFDDIISRFDITDSISHITTFHIIWSILISFILITHFYFYFSRESDNNIEREETGTKALKRSLYTWFLLIPPLLGYGLVLFSPSLFQIAGILIFFASSGIKWYIDILTILKDHDYFDWFKKISQKIAKLMTLSTK